MANANDTYVIERDERDMGGGLTVVAEFDNYQAAKAAWDKVAVPVNDKLVMWLLRRVGGSPLLKDTIVIDVKSK